MMSLVKGSVWHKTNSFEFITFSTHSSVVVPNCTLIGCTKTFYSIAILVFVPNGYCKAWWKKGLSLHHTQAAQALLSMCMRQRVAKMWDSLNDAGQGSLTSSLMNFIIYTLLRITHFPKGTAIGWLLFHSIRLYFYLQELFLHVFWRIQNQNQLYSVFDIKKPSHFKSSIVNFQAL